ncbi:MAG: competence/damage-inducible protein A [Ectothiorhodospiraceae bacterium]|nr:competence/damage-inducible protein A [Chromatiales bacterium]MCP5156452.1 competence/damage-inducible protein A [Ectothiorhodospiraceae bacterium]
MDEERVYTAAVLVIGNEVLSGRIQDANLAFLAGRLKAQGIRLREARVIPDVDSAIIDAVNTLRAAHDYVFTTGGIGPTHDDITAECIARAFGVALERNPDAVRILEDHYGDELNEARLRMANIPAGGALLDNPVSRAPGFRLGNVYVLPGVPRIMQAMFDGFRHTLAGGRPLRSRTVTAFLPESQVAEGLAAIQARRPEVEIGSYPWVRKGRFGAALVVRAVEASDLDTVSDEIAAMVRALGCEPEITEGESAPPPD